MKNSDSFFSEILNEFDNTNLPDTNVPIEGDEKTKKGYKNNRKNNSIIYNQGNADSLKKPDNFNLYGNSTINKNEKQTINSKKNASGLNLKKRIASSLSKRIPVINSIQNLNKKQDVPSTIMPGVAKIGLFDKIFGAQGVKDEMSDGGIFNIKLTIGLKVKIAIAACVIMFFSTCLICFLLTSNVYLKAMVIADSSNSGKVEAEIDKMDDEEKSKVVTDSEYEKVNNLETYYIDYTQSSLVNVADSEPNVTSNFREFYNQYVDESDGVSVYSAYRLFYKLSKIQKYYKREYNVDLDMALIMSTLMSVTNNDMTELIKNYTPSIGNLIISVFNTRLKYDYDWSNYQITQGKGEYDLELLAHNMISMKATEVCTTSSGEIVSSNDISDDDTQGLSCGEGETYSVGNKSYKIDDDKYREFLKEYIEKKKYLNSGNGSNGGGGHTVITESAYPEYVQKMVDLGYNELSITDSNIGGSKYKNDYGTGSCTHWCVVFAWWLAANTKIGDTAIYPDLMPFKTASTGEMMKSFIDSDLPNIHFYYNTDCSLYNKRLNNGVEYVPKPGDYIFFSWNNPSVFWDRDNNTQDHTGIVMGIKEDTGEVITLNGNFGGSGYKCAFAESSEIQLVNYPRSSCKIIGYGSWQ